MCVFLHTIAFRSSKCSTTEASSLTDHMVLKAAHSLHPDTKPALYGRNSTILFISLLHLSINIDIVVDIVNSS